MEDVFAPEWQLTWKYQRPNKVPTDKLINNFANVDKTV